MTSKLLGVAASVLGAGVLTLIGWLFADQHALKTDWNRRQDQQIADIVDTLVGFQTSQSQNVAQVAERMAAIRESSDNIFVVLDKRINRLETRMVKGDQEHRENLGRLINQYLNHTHHGMPGKPHSDGTGRALPGSLGLRPFERSRGGRGDRTAAFHSEFGRHPQGYAIQRTAERDPVTGLRRAQLLGIPAWGMSH